MLHGSGVDCFDLYSAASRFVEALPGVLFVFPNAPQSYRDVLSEQEVATADEERPGTNWEKHRTWVGSVAHHEPNREAAVAALSDAVSFPVRGLSRLADLLLAQYSLKPSALGVYGFSQGGMMAIYLGLSRKPECAAVVCHSGHFAGVREVHARPQTLVIVGSLELEPNQKMSQIYPRTLQELRNIAVPFTEHVCNGLAHGVNAEVIARSCEFLSATNFGRGEF